MPGFADAGEAAMTAAAFQAGGKEVNIEAAYSGPDSATRPHPGSAGFEGAGKVFPEKPGPADK